MKYIRSKGFISEDGRTEQIKFAGSEKRKIISWRTLRISVRNTGFGSLDPALATKCNGQGYSWTHTCDFFNAYSITSDKISIRFYLLT